MEKREFIGRAIGFLFCQNMEGNGEVKYKIV